MNTIDKKNKKKKTKNLKEKKEMQKHIEEENLKKIELQKSEKNFIFNQ